MRRVTKIFFAPPPLVALAHRRPCSTTERPVIIEVVSSAESQPAGKQPEISDVAAAFRRMAAGIPESGNPDVSVPDPSSLTSTEDVATTLLEDDEVPTIDQLLLKEKQTIRGDSSEEQEDTRKETMLPPELSIPSQPRTSTPPPLKLNSDEFSIADPERKGATAASEPELLHDLKKAARERNKQRLETLLLEVHDRMALELLVSRSSGKLVLSGLDDQLEGVVSKHLNKIQVAKRSTLCFGSYHSVATLLAALQMAPLEVLLMEETRLWDERSKLEGSKMKIRNHIMTTGKSTVRVFPLIEAASYAFKYQCRSASVAQMDAEPPSIEMIAEALLKCNSFSNEHLLLIVSGLTTRLTRLCADCTPAQAVHLRFLSKKCDLFDLPAVNDTLDDIIVGAVRAGKLNPSLRKVDLKQSTEAENQEANETELDFDFEDDSAENAADDQADELPAVTFIKGLRTISPKDVHMEGVSQERGSHVEKQKEITHWSEEDASGRANDRGNSLSGKENERQASDLEMWRAGLRSIFAELSRKYDKQLASSRGDLTIKLPKNSLRLPEHLTTFTFSGTHLPAGDFERVPLVIVNTPPKSFVRFSHFLQDSTLLEDLLKIESLIISQEGPFGDINKLQQLYAFMQFGTAVLKELNPQVQNWILIYMVNLGKALTDFLWLTGSERICPLVDAASAQSTFLEKYCDFIKTLKSLSANLSGISDERRGTGSGMLAGLYKVLVARSLEILLTATCGEGVILRSKDQQSLTGLSFSGWLSLAQHLSGAPFSKRTDQSYLVSSRGDIKQVTLSRDQLAPARCLVLGFQFARFFMRVKQSSNGNLVSETFFFKVEIWKAFLSNTRAFQDFEIKKDEKGKIARVVPMARFALTVAMKLCGSLVSEVRSHSKAFSDPDFANFYAQIHRWHQPPASVRSRTGKEVKILRLPLNFTERDTEDLIPSELRVQKIRRAKTREFGFVVTFGSNIDAERAVLTLDGLEVRGSANMPPTKLVVAPLRTYEGRSEKDFATERSSRKDLPSLGKTHKERIFQPRGERAWLPARHTFSVGSSEKIQEDRTRRSQTSPSPGPRREKSVVCTRSSSATLVLRFYLKYQGQHAFTAENIHLEVGQYVIVERDRSQDLARVISLASTAYKHPKGKILRLATKSEVARHDSVQMRGDQILEKARTLMDNQFANLVEVLNAYLTFDEQHITVFIKLKKTTLDSDKVRTVLVKALHGEYHARIYVSFVGLKAQSGKRPMKHSSTTEGNPARGKKGDENITVF